MPLWFLLIPYAIFLVVFVIFSFINIYNAWRFRSGFFSSIFLIAIYLAGTSVIIFMSYFFLMPVDWAIKIEFDSFGATLQI